MRKFIDGLTLQKLIEGGHQFTTLQVVQILKQVCEALSVPERQAAADGRPFPHGGVKPSNVFLRGKDRVVLGDFAAEHRLTGIDLDRMVYDYRYVAPEAFLHAPQTTVSDFYSLGCVGYELLVGEAPVVGHTAFEIAANHLSQQIRPQGARWDALAAPVRDLILRLLSKSPADRPATCEELSDQLNDLIRMLKSGGMPPAGPGPVSAGPPKPVIVSQGEKFYGLEFGRFSQVVVNQVSMSPGTLIGQKEAAKFESNYWIISADCPDIISAA